MKEKKRRRWKYYYIEHLDVLGRRDDSECESFVFNKGSWVEDCMHMIDDRLYGFVDDGDSWGFGDTDTRNEIQQISRDRAKEIMADQVSRHILDDCINKYKKDEWEYSPGWWRRVATTDFVIYGMDLGVSFIRDCLDTESFGQIRDEIEKELKALGAKEIVSVGYTEDRSDEDVEEICDQFVDHLLEVWSECFAEEKAEWDKNPGWQSKNVKTVFWISRKRYVVYPEMIGLERNGWDDAFMETIQKNLEEDLNHYGIRAVNHYGDID